MTLVSDPGTYIAPTASELAIADSFINTLPGNLPGSIFNVLRNAPNTLLNPGLDATALPPFWKTTRIGKLTLPVSAGQLTKAYNCLAAARVFHTLLYSLG